MAGVVIGNFSGTAGATIFIGYVVFWVRGFNGYVVFWVRGAGVRMFTVYDMRLPFDFSVSL